MPFLSFFFLIVLARTSNTILNKSGKSGHPSLIPDLRRKSFSLSSLIILAEGLLYVAVIMLRYLLSIPTLLSVLIINGCCMLSDAFLCTY